MRLVQVLPAFVSLFLLQAAAAPVPGPVPGICEYLVTQSA